MNKLFNLTPKQKQEAPPKSAVAGLQRLKSITIGSDTNKPSDQTSTQFDALETADNPLVAELDRKGSLLKHIGM